MDKHSPNLGDILGRLEKVEKENRRLKRIVAVGSLLAAVLLIMGQARPRRTIEAEKFVLKDANGSSRAQLGMDSNGPTLSLQDANGVPLVALSGGDYSFLTLFRTGSKEQVTMSANKEFYGMVLYDEKSHRAGLAVWKGIPGLTLYDEKGTERAGLVAPDGGPSLKLEDQNGYSAIFGSTDLITPSTGRKEMTSVASLTLFGRDKKVLWSAP